MPHGIAINPLRLKFTQLPDLGNSVYRIEPVQLPPLTELLRWPGIRGMDLLWLKDVEFGLTRIFEYEEDRLHETMSLIMPEMLNPCCALQILSPSHEQRLTLAFKSLDTNQELCGVGVPYLFRPTKWAAEVRYPLEELRGLSSVTQRIQLAVPNNLSRPHSALSARA